MLVMLICMIVGAMFFRWLQDEDYMKNFGSIIGSFTGFFIGLLLSIAIGLAVVPTTTTKIEEYNITRNKDEFEKYGAEVNLNIPICKYEEDHQCRFDCPIFGTCGEKI